MEACYYNQLPRNQQIIYHQILTGLSDLASSFSVAKIDRKTCSDLFFMLRLDHPEIFYASGFRCRSYPQADSMEFIPEYIFEKNKIREHKKALEARTTKIARMAEKLGESEKELFIHDFICENVHYDKLKKAYSHEIIGPLAQGVGVCEGIAKSVKILCDRLGIWCMIAVSDANPEKKIKYRHAWNVVRIGGQYYHLDATFDLSLSKPDASGERLIRHDYVNLPDSLIFRDHEPVIYPVPPCTDSDHFYYKEKKISFTKMEDVRKRALQAARKQNPLLFHWRGGYLTRPVLEELLETLAQAGAEKNRYASVHLNYAQAVFQVSFTEMPSESRYETETANEGESETAADRNEIQNMRE